MRTSTQHELITRLVALLNGAPHEIASRTTRLDTQRYTSPDELTRELDRVFPSHPLIACHASEVANTGDVLSVEVAGIGLLVARSASGLHVNVNACVHRGATLVSERRCEKKKALTCPYHAWTYRLDGSLVHVPGETLFGSLDKISHSLRTVSHEVRHGLVWVQLDGRPLDVASYLGSALDEDLDAFALHEHNVAAERVRLLDANWKLVMDAFAEGYHLKSLHQKSLARFFADAAIVDDLSPHVRQVGARRTLSEVRDTPEAWDLRRHTTVFYNVFPNAIFVFHPTWVSLLTLWPAGASQVRVEHRMLAPAGTDEAGLAKSFALIDQGVFEREDFMIAANIQRNLARGGPDEMLLGAAEEGMRLFHLSRDRALEEDGCVGVE